MRKRKLYNEVKRHVAEKEYTVITGARQTGKTTLLMQLQEDLLSENKNVRYISLEDPDILSGLNDHPENIFNYLTLNGKDKTYLLLDEIQYLDNPSNFLKFLFDKYASRLKIVATGSSAFYIDRKFKDSLAGRKRLFTLYTLDFDEFLEFKTESTSLTEELIEIRKNEKYQSLKRRELSILFSEYLTFGGYPAVVLSNTPEKKKLLLKDLVHSYLQKDILESRVRDEKNFYSLLILLASQAGNILNMNELSNTLGISVTAVENYIYILQKSFHVHLIRPFHTNIRKELTKMPKIYFNDIGFRNTILNSYQSIETRLDKGALIENYAFIRLRQKVGQEYLKFWRTTGGNEIDFIINVPGKSKKEAIEIKFNSTSFNKKKYKKFLEIYPEFTLNVRALTAKNNATDILAL